jgi:hypothetical protein
MRLFGAIPAAIGLVSISLLAAFGSAAQADPSATEECEVPPSLIETDLDLNHVLTEVKDKHQLDISVIGTGSSSISGPDGAHYAYPAQLGEVLKQQLSGLEIRVAAHVQLRATTATMVSGLAKILADDKPVLVIWQTGTTDAMNGVEPEDFRASLNEGVAAMQAANADVILMNMQYSPRTESMLDVSPYADVMRWVAQQHSALLFDRLAIMHYWNDAGVFALYTATKKYDMARRVHECIARALASQIINAAHLDAVRMQTTR